jgi:NAD(P) transhydrogenase subunit beta
MDTVIQISYFVSAVLFILGLKRMSSPVTARGGIVWAGVGMLVATLITFLYPGMQNYLLITVAIALGGGLAFWSGKQVAMTNMPQMIALYNGMGGGAAGAIAAVELLGGFHSGAFLTSPAGLIGRYRSRVPHGSRNTGLMRGRCASRSAPHQPGSAGAAPTDSSTSDTAASCCFFALALALCWPCRLGADMPVIISLQRPDRARGRSKVSCSTTPP